MNEIELIKKFEGCKLNAYVDPGTGAEPITIGYGNTHYEDGSKVKLGDKITQQRAEQLLNRMVIPFGNNIDKMVKTKITPNMRASLISFTYNIGIANFNCSTLLNKVNLNPNDISIKDEFLKWNKSGGKVMNGLTSRREMESENYFS